MNADIRIDIKNDVVNLQTSDSQNSFRNTDINVREMNEKYEGYLRVMMAQNAINKRSIEKVQNGKLGTKNGPRNVKILTVVSAFTWILNFVGLVMSEFYDNNKAQKGVTVTFLITAFVVSAIATYASWRVDENQKKEDKLNSFKPKEIDTLKQFVDLIQKMVALDELAQELKKNASGEVAMQNDEEINQKIDQNLHECMEFLKNLPKLELESTPTAEQMFTKIIRLLPDDHLYKRTVDAIQRIAHGQELPGQEEELPQINISNLATQNQDATSDTFDGLDLAKQNLSKIPKNNFKDARFGMAAGLDSSENSSFGNTYWKENALKHWSVLEELRGKPIEFLEFPNYRLYKNGIIVESEI